MNYEIRKELDDALSIHIQEENAKFEQLFNELQELRRELNLLSQAWQQAKGVVSFMKWIAGIGGSIGAWFLFFKDHWK